MIRPKEVTLVSRTQPSGPLCLWQCLTIMCPLNNQKFRRLRLLGGADTSTECFFCPPPDAHHAEKPPPKTGSEAGTETDGGPLSSYCDSLNQAGGWLLTSVGTQDVSKVKKKTFKSFQFFSVSSNSGVVYKRAIRVTLIKKTQESTSILSFWLLPGKN